MKAKGTTEDRTATQKTEKCLVIAGGILIIPSEIIQFTSNLSPRREFCTKLSNQNQEVGDVTTRSTSTFYCVRTSKSVLPVERSNTIWSAGVNDDGDSDDGKSTF